MSRYAAFPRTPAVRGGSSGSASVWGEEGNPPPSVGLLLAEVVQSLQCRAGKVVRQAFIVRFYVPSESALAQPPSSFSSPRLVARFFCQRLRLGAALTQGR